MYEIVYMLLNNKAETIPMFKGRQTLEIVPPGNLDDVPSPRFLNTHMQFSDAPQQLPDKKCKIIFNLRDPKDVAVSLFNMYRDAPFFEYTGNFEDFLYLFLDGKGETMIYIPHNFALISLRQWQWVSRGWWYGNDLHSLIKSKHTRSIRCEQSQLYSPSLFQHCQ